MILDDLSKTNFLLLVFGHKHNKKNMDKNLN